MSGASWFFTIRTSSTFGAGAVTGLIILAPTVLAALAACIIGLRVGLARNTSAE